MEFHQKDGTDTGQTVAGVIIPGGSACPGLLRAAAALRPSGAGPTAFAPS